MQVKTTISALWNLTLVRRVDHHEIMTRLTQCMLGTILLLEFFYGSSLVSHVWAHEAYVLTPAQFHQGLQTTTTNPLGPLFTPAYLTVSVLIALIVTLIYVTSLLFAATSQAALLDRGIKRFANVGPVVIRLSVGAALFYAARSGVILGPELPLSQIAFGEIIRYVLFLLAFMITFGIFTEIAGIISIFLLLYITKHFGLYMLTYANYFGEFIVLTLFGARFLAIDGFVFGRRLFISGFARFAPYKTSIVRVLYGVALLYAGWNIKFVHQQLTVLVYNQYHLVRYFHADPTFIAAGAGLSEILIGVLLILGLAQRLTILISLVFITLSLLYFREMVWPHFVLYGISINLFINSADPLALDRYVPGWIRAIKGKR